jgi:2-dehydropantoate 2-reductase
MSSSSIHVLGLGNLGKLFAHALRRNHPKIPITLLFHRPTLEEEWNKAGQCIEITRKDMPDRIDGFRYEIVEDGKGAEIENLVVATKTHATVQAIRPLKDRLKPYSTMLFLQNGIGMISQYVLSLAMKPVVDVRRLR